MKSRLPKALPASAVRYRATLPGLGSSDELEPASMIIGQPNALEALSTGLAMDYPGYNIFLAGEKGTGRFVAVRSMIQRSTLECPLSRSQAYVHNFPRPDRPVLINLPRGMGRTFQVAVDALRTALSEAIPSLLGSPVMAKSRQRIVAKFERETRRLFSDFEERVGASGFAVAQTQSATGTVQLADIFPVVGGEPIAMEQVEADPKELGIEPAAVTELQKKRAALKEELGSLVLRHRQMSNRYQSLLRDTERKKMGDAIEPLFAEILQTFQTHAPETEAWLAGLKEELLENLELFRETPPGEATGTPAGASMEGFLWYVRANLLWDPAETSDGPNSCPVVEENWPTWRNLFGTIDASGDPPNPTFMDIRAGSLLRANGGFLVLYASDVIGERGVYDNLKRLLRRGQLEIAPQTDGNPVLLGLKPDPIPVKVKVVLVGERQTYDVLHAIDPDFPAIFKVKVEFEDHMPRTPATERAFLSVIKRVVDQENLPAFDGAALGCLMEEGVRMSGNQDLLTTRFSDLANVMREASHLALQRGSKVVSGDDQRAAFHARRRRHDLIERRMLDLVRLGKILLDVGGAKVGQINGLGYYEVEDAPFGMPARISATCAMGRAGIVNIERESDLSGSIHNKGVLILTGFLAATFAQDKPLSLHANIAFEQSYVTVDGDSASLAELLALLSALSNTPLRQDIAVTGSMNQHGQVQPVGGVTEKTLGFFRACKIMGLSGTQGVMLPAANVTDLHLDDECLAEIEAGRFHIYPGESVHGALEFMTGRPADEVLSACNETLSRYANIIRDFS